MDTEEVQEEFFNQEKKSLPMNHFKKYWRKTKGKRCWYCYSWGHLKNRCPYIKCFYCGFKGHTKKFCFKLDLHRAIQALRNRTPREEANDNKKERKKQTFKDRIKEVEFRKEGEDYIMSHMGKDLGIYFGDYKFEYAKGGFTHIQLPKWKMEKKIQQDIQVREVKLSKYLPHQCGDCGEVLNGWAFLHHLQHVHRGYCPAGSLINANPYRFWILWYDDRNFVRFTTTIGKPSYIKADPPWI